VCSTDKTTKKSLYIKNCKINSIIAMNILGVQFDSKVCRSYQACKGIKWAKSTLHAKRLLKGYFTKK
jgi:hypothetical protein